MKKNILVILFSFCVCLCCLTAVLFTACKRKELVLDEINYSEEDLKIAESYILIESTVERVSGYRVFRYIGTDTEISIPSRYAGLPVHSISRNAFSGNTTLKKVTVSDTVLKIDDEAFLDCTSLENVVFSESSKLISVGESSFKNCYALKSVSFSNTLRSIGVSAFSSCKNLVSVLFNENCPLSRINELTFDGCLRLNSIIIPNNVVTIANQAFSECLNLTTLSFASNTSIENINDYSFMFCERLSSLSLPEGLKVIGRFAFYGCKQIVSIQIPSTCERVSDYAFYGCLAVSNLTFANNSSLLTIGNSAFAQCTELLSVTSIPKSVKQIQNSTFFGCSKLTTVSFEDDSVLETIGDSAFELSAITSFTFVSSLKSIGVNCFKGCSSLGYIMALDGVFNTFGTGCFADCISFSTISLNIDDEDYALSFARKIAQNIPADVLVNTSINVKTEAIRTAITNANLGFSGVSIASFD